jgi:uncharacterized protein YjlB
MRKKPRVVFFENPADVPNSRLTVLIFRSVLVPGIPAKPDLFRKRFRKAGGAVCGQTRSSITRIFIRTRMKFWEFIEGKVTVRLGGEQGRLFRLKAGDMLLLPPGVGHRRVGDDKGLKLIGAYPRGQSNYDMKRKGRAA